MFSQQIAAYDRLTNAWRIVMNKDGEKYLGYFIVLLILRAGA